jgi:hypothetical protein
MSKVLDFFAMVIVGIVKIIGYFLLIMLFLTGIGFLFSLFDD